MPRARGGAGAGGTTTTRAARSRCSPQQAPDSAPRCCPEERSRGSHRTAARCTDRGYSREEREDRGRNEDGRRRTWEASRDDIPNPEGVRIPKEEPDRGSNRNARRREEGCSPRDTLPAKDVLTDALKDDRQQPDAANSTNGPESSRPC